MTTTHGAAAICPRGSAWEVLVAFFKLGVTSFGGPAAHLGFFRADIVDKRGWISDEEYADLVALCQFLPGPASSQVGFALGLHRAGYLGAFAAFVGFTLPSAALMVALACGASVFSGMVGVGILKGLVIAAVAIVAHAVLGMARSLTPDARRASIAVIAACLALVFAGAAGQVIAIGCGALAGLALCRSDASPAPSVLRFPVGRTGGVLALVVFVGLLCGLPVLAHASNNGSVSIADAFYRAGALVFGGGHVVLPLLESGVVGPGWVSESEFLAGYGAAQAVPGPLFTLAAYLGAVAGMGPGGVAGAALALAAIFAPGFLLLIAALPAWDRFRTLVWAQSAMRGANAAVVGILTAALYSPVFTTAITGVGPFCLALACFVLLHSWKLPPWSVVVCGAAGGLLLQAL